MPRLYLQRGLSDRVVNAVVRRLERVLNMSSGDRVDAVEETRTRSRSRTRGGAEGTAPGISPGGTGEAVPDLGVPMPVVEAAVPDSAIRLPEATVQSDSTKLAEQLTQCLNKLQGVSFELSAAVDGFSDSHDKLREEIGKLGLKIERQANALTTVGASLAAETNEVGKLLKAFDKFASNFRWSFSGKHSVEENLGFLQARIVEQTGGLEASLGGALAGISGILEQIRQNMAREVVPPPPHIPAPTADTGVGVPMPMDAVVPDVGGNPLTTGTPLLPGYASGPGSHVGAPPAAAPPAAAKAGACPGRASASTELVSIFLCYCAESVGGARPTTPANME